MDRRTGFGTAGTYLAEEKTPARRRLLKTLKTRPLHHSWAGWVCDKIITLDFAHDKAGNAKDMASDAKGMAYDKAGNAKEMAYEKARHLQMT
ncbi:unnamed protein product [Brassica oleracea var. botrytis]